MVTRMKYFFSSKIDIDDHWSKWSEWSQCSKSCGNGTQTRNRTRNRTSINETETEQKECNLKPCPGKGSVLIFQINDMDEVLCHHIVDLNIFPLRI